MNMKKTLTLLASTFLAGCGVAQSVKDGTVDAAKWAFTTQVKTLNLDLTSRAAINQNGAGHPLSTVVRVYQLKDAKIFDALDYAQLQSNDLQELKADLLATKDVVLQPNASASISEPMNEDAEFVGVVAFFRQADKDAAWKIAIPKKQWKKTDPVQLQVIGDTLQMAGANPEPVKRTVPVQSVREPAKVGALAQAE
jgi:type VI secretion system protein VasD